ncbi:MAG: DUF58 domain-containing protein [Planctomycetes bacterium]|nr:DUF58 domain-containing protein [Planctomycetota bacterium]NUQ34694.1 DUF58 domain-containing protein [Planctomycetaceae bacterium]
MAEATPTVDLLAPEFRERLEHLRLVAQQVRSSGRGGTHLTRLRGSGLEFAGHRPYSPGDDLRYLDWAALGRLDQLVLKQFDVQGDVTVVLAPDCSTSMDYGEPSKLDLVRQLTGALGYLALHSADQVALAPLTGGAFERFSGPAHVHDWLDRASRLRRNKQGLQMRGWIEQARSIHGAALFIVMTDFLQRADVLNLFGEIRRRNAPVIAIYPIAPQEFNPPLSGRSALTAIESGERLKLDITPETLDAYKRELNLYRAAIQASCRRIGAGLLEIGTHERMEDVVLMLVAHRIIRVGRS